MSIKTGAVSLLPAVSAGLGFFSSSSFLQRRRKEFWEDLLPKKESLSYGCWVSVSTVKLTNAWESPASFLAKILYTLVSVEVAFWVKTKWIDLYFISYEKTY